MESPAPCDRCGTDVNQEFIMLLPKLDIEMPKNELTNSERRQATAKLRHRWLKLRYNGVTDDNMKTRLRQQKQTEEYRRVLDRLKKQQNGTPIQTDSLPKVKRANTALWEGEIQKRNIIQRVPFSRIIQLPPTEARACIKGVNVQPRAMFYSASAPAQGRLHQRERERRRMHFISTEWGSEHVSWHRFYNTNLPEQHTFSWIQ